MDIEHLPTDLILEIISRLPSKYVARCRCVSKLWASLLTLSSPYFTELFLTQSKTRPCLLFAVQQYDKWLLYSCPQPQISYKSPLSVTAEFHMSFPGVLDLERSFPISGLIYRPNMRNNDGLNYPVFCNPSTGQILWLPELKVGGKSVDSYVGYDPIDKQFTVLSFSFSLKSTKKFPSNFQILKIGSGNQLFWRNLECPLQLHFTSSLNTYVNGVLYYVARVISPFSRKIACFDCKSEEFKFIDVPWHYYDEPHVLVNFKGKLCGITTSLVLFSERYHVALLLWILEDFEKQEWSKHLYRLPSGLCSKKYEETQVYVVGVSVTGDIVLSLHSKNSLYVCFYNTDTNSLQEVEIKGLEKFKSTFCYAFVDNVEDLRIL